MPEPLLVVAVPLLLLALPRRITQVEMARFGAAFQPLRHPVAGTAQGSPAAALLLTASAGGAAGGDEVPQPLSPLPFSPFPFPLFLLSFPLSPLQHPTHRNAAPGKTNSWWVSGFIFLFGFIFLIYFFSVLYFVAY